MKKILYMSFLMSSSLYAQSTLDTTNQVIQMNEAVISINKIDEKQKEVTQQFSIINRQEITNLNANNTADLLSSSGTVTIQKSQQGGGSPVIRGFEASRVLLVVDGVRMNNLIYRSGHLQNVITTDQNILDRVEILYGPSSTVYGSDALGGVVHLHTKNPVFAKEGTLTTGNAMLRYGTVNNEFTGHADFNVANKNFASLTSFSYSTFGDLKSGKNKLFQDSVFGQRYYYTEHINGKDSMVKNSDIWNQNPSGYSQYDVLQKFSLKSGEHVLQTLNLQYSTSSDVPRYDRLTDTSANGNFAFAQWYYGPQSRFLAAYNIEIDNADQFFQKIDLNVNYQNVLESRYTRRFNSSNLSGRNEEVNMAGFDFDMNNISDNNNFRLGFEGQYNWLHSTANKENINTGELNPIDTRYPDGENTMSNFAIYATDDYQFNKKWNMNAGMRLQQISLYAQFENQEFFPFPFDDIQQNNLALSGNIGVNFLPTEKWKLSAMFCTGFRAPNIDDLSKVFESGDGIVIVPNPSLEPEKTYNTDLSITKFFGDKIKWENVFYYTMFKDAITTDKFTFNGNDSIIYDGTPSAVYASQNKAEAYIYGFNSNIQAGITDYLSVTATVSYTYGRIKTDSVDQPLDHIAPLYGRVGIQYNKKKLTSEFSVNFNGKKDIKDYYLNGEDNEQYAPAGGMPAWFTLNLRAGYQVAKPLMVQAGVENILNTQYRTFSSGINAPGINFYVTLRASF